MKHNVGTSSPALLDALESRFGLQLAARLTEGASELSPDVTERLRFAREQALNRARVGRPVVAHAPQMALVGAAAGGGAGLGGGSGWWFKIATALPVLALVAGLLVIQFWQDNAQISTAAEIDAALLADDLPPAAYSDAGFVEFLKTPPHE